MATSPSKKKTKSRQRSPAGARRGRPAAPPEPVRTLTDLEQIKVLADPLRLRIVEALDEERTTKQVAERIGEKPTKLYHHVEALERVGLIRMTRTRRKRGTLEKYYIAAARQFRADSRLFVGEQSSGGEDDLTAVATTILEQTAADLRRLGPDCRDASGPAEETAVLAYVEVRADPGDIERLRARLQEILDESQRAAEREDRSRSLRRYRLTLAFFPLDVAPE